MGTQTVIVGSGLGYTGEFVIDAGGRGIGGEFDIGTFPDIKGTIEKDNGFIDGNPGFIEGARVI